VTDCEGVEGSEHARLLVDETEMDMLVIKGREVVADWGCLLAYNIKENFSEKGEPGTICGEIHKQGGYAFAAHPYWIDTRETFWEKGLFESMLEEGDLDGFELINAEAVPPYDNIPVIEKHYALRVKKKFYPVVGNSGSRSVKTIGKNIKMYVLAESLTEKHIMDAILKGRCVMEWQKRFYGEDQYFSDIDLWFREDYIEHLQKCQEEVGKNS